MTRMKQQKGGMSSDFFNYIIVFVTSFFIITFVALILYFASKDNQITLLKQYIYMFSIMLPLIFIFGSLVHIWTDDSSVKGFLAIVGIILFLFGFLIGVYLTFIYEFFFKIFYNNQNG